VRGSPLKDPSLPHKAITQCADDGNALDVRPHRGGVGDGRHLRDVDRGYGAAAALWRQRQAQLELGRRRCRQDEGRAVGAAGQKPRHCRTHQCAGRLSLSNLICTWAHVSADQEIPGHMSKRLDTATRPCGTRATARPAPARTPAGKAWLLDWHANAPEDLVDKACRAGEQVVVISGERDQAAVDGKTWKQ